MESIRKSSIDHYVHDTLLTALYLKIGLMDYLGLTKFPIGLKGKQTIADGKLVE